MSNKKVKTFGKRIYVRGIARKMLKHDCGFNRIRNF